jgi:hypothetical protein
MIMEFRERPSGPFDRQQAQPLSSGDPAGGDVSRIREAGEAFLKAGDDAINRALSGNSEAFLAAGRQQGGE